MTVNKTPTKARRFLLKTFTKSKQTKIENETKLPHRATHPVYYENILFIKRTPIVVNHGIIDGHDVKTWPPTNTIVKDDILYRIIKSKILVITRRANWPMEFDRNEKKLNNKPNKNLPANTEIRNKLENLVYRGYYLLQKNSGSNIFYRSDNLTLWFTKTE